MRPSGKRILRLLLLLLSPVVLIAAGIGIWRLTRAVSTTPDQLTLYSIDGRPPEERTVTGEEYHGFPVLGKLDITSAPQRTQIMKALNRGIVTSDGTSSKCFWPRHGIRTVEKGRTVDYVICFHCRLIYVHENGVTRSESTTDGPKAALNQVLSDAGIPRAPDDD